jgi:DNA-binding winged helix-turn-helix (wHTH) protein
MSARVRFGTFELDPHAPRLLRGGQPVALSAEELDALVLLVERSGGVVSKDELFRKVWPGTFVRARALTRLASSLRAALGDDAAFPRYVETVPRRGYRFIAKIEREEAQ